MRLLLDRGAIVDSKGDVSTCELAYQKVSTYCSNGSVFSWCVWWNGVAVEFQDSS